MEVRHALADAVVDRHKRSVSRKPRLDGPREQPHICEKRGDQRIGEVAQRRDVLSWDQQTVAREERPVIEKGQTEGVLEYNLCRDYSSRYPAEETASVIHTARIPGRRPRQSIVNIAKTP